MSVFRLSLPAPVTGRLQGIDELKGVAIILVILYHAGGVLVWNNFFHFDLGVDLFVILSGVGLGFGAHYSGAASFLARRLVRILPGYWLILTLCLVGNAYFLNNHYTATNIGIHFLGLQSWFGDECGFSINDSFWYVTLALALYAFYCVGHALLDSPDRLLLLGAAISVFITWVFLLSAGYGSLTGHLALRLPGFFIGLLVGRLLKTGRIEFKLGPMLVFALCLFAYVPYLFGSVIYTPLVGLSLMGVCLFPAQSLATLPFAGAVGRGLRFLGRHSLEIFLIHQPLIREYNYYAYRRWFNNGAPSNGLLLAGIGVGLALTLLLSVGLHQLLEKIPLPFPPHSSRGAAPTGAAS